jgi:hypothetical protein
MPLGNDPTPLAELEAGFGVTSSAEELIKANQSRMTNEQRASGMKPVNDELTGQLLDDQSKLEDHLGHEVVNASVRGNGASALIHYVYIGSRDAHESDYVPFADVYGDKAAKQRRSALQARQTDPDEAASAAASEKLREADEQAAQTMADARAEAEKLLSDAKAKIDKLVEDASAKIEKQREQVPEEAQSAAEKAREDAEKAKAEAAKPATKAKPGGK